MTVEQVAPCPLCWMGRHSECEGVFLTAAGNPQRCTCKQNNHQQPTMRVRDDQPATNSVLGLLEQVAADLARAAITIATLTEHHKRIHDDWKEPDATAD